MTNFKVKESFSWLAPEAFKVETVGKNTVKVRGVALKADTVSKNKRRYVKEELQKAARTWIGKPVTINHDDKKIVGHVEWMEFEDPLLEYLITVKKQPYVSMFRNADKAIRGVSVQADYLYNRCVKCGERFYDAESYIKHMKEVELVKDVTEEPHGINGTALSVVVEPEVPGVHGTTTELWETLHIARDGGLQLLETVTNVKKQEMEWKQKVKNVALTPEKRIPAIPRKIKEQEPKTDAERAKAHFNISDEEWEKLSPEEKQAYIDKLPPLGQKRKKTEEQAPPTQQELPEPTVAPPTPCPEGFTYDEESGTCVPKEWPEEPTAKTPSPQITPEPTIEPPKVAAPEVPAPVAVPPILEQEEGVLPPAPFPATPTEAPAAVTQECPEGSHYDAEAGTCVPDEITADVVLVREQEGPAPAQTSIPEAPSKITQECPEGSHYDEVSGTCVPDEIEEQPVGAQTPAPIVKPAVVSEVRLPPLLTLGEPFADYSSFEDCVEKNRGKVDDPEAYCATIKRKVEGETVKESVYAGLPLLQEIETKGLVRDVKLAQAVNQQSRANAKIVQGIQKIPNAVNRQMATESKLRGTSDKQITAQTNRKLLTESRLRSGYDKQVLQQAHKGLLTESKLRAESDDALVNQIRTGLLAESKLRGAYDKAIFREVATIPKALKEISQASLGYTQKCTNAILEALQRRDAYYNRKLSQLATESKKIRDNQVATTSQLSKKIDDTKRGFEKVLAYADKNAEEMQGNIKTLEDRLKEQEEKDKEKCPEGQHRDPETGECVPNESTEETKKLKETVEKLETKVDNLNAKLKGDFKGHNKPVGTEGSEGYVDPAKIQEEATKSARKKK